MRRCILCGKPMVLVAPGVLIHVDELQSILSTETAYPIAS